MAKFIDHIKIWVGTSTIGILCLDTEDIEELNRIIRATGVPSGGTNSVNWPGVTNVKDWCLRAAKKHCVELELRLDIQCREWQCSNMPTVNIYGYKESGCYSKGSHHLNKLPKTDLIAVI